MNILPIPPIIGAHNCIEAQRTCSVAAVLREVVLGGGGRVVML